MRLSIEVFMKYDNPYNWNNPFEILRERDNLVSIWLKPANDPEGEHLATLSADYLQILVAALKRFEQAEGRQAQGGRKRKKKS